MLKAGQHQLLKKKAISIINLFILFNPINTCVHDYVLSVILIFCRIVLAFDNIVESLIEFENFTNVSVNADDVLLRGERVSKFKHSIKIMSCNIIVSRYLETSMKEELFLLLVCKVIITRL